MGEVKCTSR